jgi:acetate kinase
MILVVEPNNAEIIFWVFEEEGGILHRQRVAKDYDDIRNSKDLQDTIRFLKGKKKIEAISFFINFGGNEFNSPVLINNKFFPKFARLMSFKPLYISTCHSVLHNFWEKFKDTPMKVFFDTAFFNALPESEKYYALPYKYYPRNNLRRWGFHGILHEMNAFLMPEEAKVISVVLDKESTISAIKDRRPVAISLGYTPLEGVMSRTSCGDLDAGIVFYLMKHCGLSIFKIDQILKKESGFLGLTGYDLNMEQLLKYHGRDPRVDLAFSVYENQILKYIGEGISLLGGVDYIVFSGSTAKLLIPVIHHILRQISFLGVQLKGSPWGGKGKIEEVTLPGSPIKAYLNRHIAPETIFYLTAFNPKTLKLKTAENKGKIEHSLEKA